MHQLESSYTFLESALHGSGFTFSLKSALSAKEKISLRTAVGLSELWVPSKRTIFLLAPRQQSQSIWEWEQCIILSSFAAKNRICLSPFAAAKYSLISNYLGCMSLFSSTSLPTMQKKQGNMHQKRQQSGMQTCVLDNSLQVAQRLENAESAITTSASLLSKPLTAPILLPHTATLKPRPFRNFTAISTSRLSCFPKEMNYFSTLFPHPLKSKQARPTSGGKRGSWAKPSYLLELFPCRQSITYLMLRGVQREMGKGM